MVRLGAILSTFSPIAVQSGATLVMKKDLSLFTIGFAIVPNKALAFIRIQLRNLKDRQNILAAWLSGQLGVFVEGIQRIAGLALEVPDAEVRRPCAA